MNIKYYEGTELLLLKALELKSDFELLKNEFKTVAEIPSILQLKCNYKSIPNYMNRVINIVLQFESNKDLNILNGYYRNHFNLYLAGDPTGTVNFIINKEVDKDLMLVDNTFMVLHVPVIVVNGMIFLHANIDTKFINCSKHNDNFINPSNHISSKFKVEIINRE